MTAMEMAEAANFMQRRLQELGYEVLPPDDGTQQAPRITPEKTKAGRLRKTVDVRYGGRDRRLPATHPMVTGEMVKTPASSNVYGFAYDLPNRLLYVRFKAPAPSGEARPNAPGPLYQYRHVPPNIFESLLAAGSKGTWVWDHLRIRGTVSGHQYDYSLVGITGGYVPRKATMTAQGEAYTPRTVHVGEGEELTSRRGFEIVRPFAGQPRRPHTGAPRRPRS
jgi:hypothetical protein